MEELSAESVPSGQAVHRPAPLLKVPGRQGKACAREAAGGVGEGEEFGEGEGVGEGLEEANARQVRVTLPGLPETGLDTL